MERKRKFRWFIEPIGSYTNESLAKYIAEENAIFNGRRDAGGVPRKVYEVKKDELRDILASKTDSEFTFKVLVQEGDGKMRDVTNVLRRRGNSKKRRAKVIRASELQKHSTTVAA